MEKNTFTVINERGEEVLCYVLFTFESDETGKNYIAYTDNSYDDNGKINVFASTYNPHEEDGTTLYPIETDKEWNMIQMILESLQKEIRQNKDKDQVESH